MDDATLMHQMAGFLAGNNNNNCGNFVLPCGGCYTSCALQDLIPINSDSVTRWICRRCYTSQLIQPPTRINSRMWQAPSVFDSTPVEKPNIVKSYSRKVFVGRLPDSINPGNADGKRMESFFQQFGKCGIEWPKPPSHVVSTKAQAKLSGYLFILYRCPSSVPKLLRACKMNAAGQYYLDFVEWLGQAIHVRPFDLADRCFYRQPNIKLDHRDNTLFLGRVPRMATAEQIFNIMEEKFGSVKYVQIDLDHHYSYPQGTATVFFDSNAAFLKAIITKNLDMRSISGRSWTTEMKPYVLFGLDCEQCRGRRGSFFCADVSCLQYYCDYCWAAMHSGSRRSHECVAEVKTLDTPINSHVRSQKHTTTAGLTPSLPHRFKLVKNQLFIP